ncbi:MAG: hypothetical protein AAF533_09260 [Acidobacteriota bacterium]
MSTREFTRASTMASLALLSGLLVPLARAGGGYYLPPLIGRSLDSNSRLSPLDVAHAPGCGPEDFRLGLRSEPCHELANVECPSDLPLPGNCVENPAGFDGVSLAACTSTSTSATVTFAVTFSSQDLDPLELYLGGALEDESPVSANHPGSWTTVTPPAWPNPPGSAAVTLGFDVDSLYLIQATLVPDGLGESGNTYPSGYHAFDGDTENYWLELTEQPSGKTTITLWKLHPDEPGAIGEAMTCD